MLIRQCYDIFYKISSVPVQGYDLLLKISIRSVNAQPNHAVPPLNLSQSPAMSQTISTDQVQVISRHPVQCASETATSVLESPFKLGPLDHMVLPFVPVDAVFIYRKPISDANADDNALLEVGRLLRALALVLDYYPHLTGRLHFDPKSHRPEIVSLGLGAELLEARCKKRTSR